MPRCTPEPEHHFLQGLDCIHPRALEATIARIGRMPLDMHDAAALLSPDASPHLPQLARLATNITRQRFGHAIKLFAPLYVSNECVNICRYCGFSRNNSIERATLSVEQVRAEAQMLIAQGHRHILIVAGEHPKKIPLPYLEEIARTLRPHLAELLVEVQPFDVESYRRLHAAGFDGVVLYQETYDQETYAKLHTAGPKRDFWGRIAAADAAAESGMRFVALGALLGLADPRHDMLAVIAHAREMIKQHWRTSIGLGFPRLKPCASGFSATHPVSDAQLMQYIVATRLILPDVDITLSTREPETLRNQLLPLGITRMSAGSRTAPGAYSEASASGKQFEISDMRTPADVARAISHAGLEPVWKDWDAGFTTAD